MQVKTQDVRVNDSLFDDKNLQNVSIHIKLQENSINITFDTEKLRPYFYLLEQFKAKKSLLRRKTSFVYLTYLCAT